MKLVADLHIHSHYSRATSKDLTFEHLGRWAQLKGVHLVGAGDIAHPGWLQEMREKLTPAEEGLFRLKDEYATAAAKRTSQRDVPPACRGTVRFMLTGEISNIYAKGGQTRKIHNVIFAPTFQAVERLQAALEKIGNIRADGRPILGLDSRDLLETILELDPACYLIPAHIWTPWFSLLGSKSGFDSVEECFGDLTPHIFALETGLSSDPPMNWRVSALDRYTLISNSDAHSPEKLGREATLFDAELSYPAILDALKTGDPRTFLGTIEFFPEEGKYHFDGHRKCGVAWHPQTTLAHGGICPQCGKGVTVGVMHRVELLADRPRGGRPARTHPFASLIPLPEVLGEVYGVGPGSKQVEAEYMKLLGRVGPELAILQDAPLEEIAAAGGERLAEGIGRMRRGEVVAEAGYDGKYGIIRLFGGTGRQVSAAQMGLFGEELSPVTIVREEQAAYEAGDARSPLKPAGYMDHGEPHFGEAHFGEAHFGEAHFGEAHFAARSTQHAPLLAGLNPQQRAAVLCTDAPLIIVAGPGTGKTRTLTVRIAYLIQEKGVPPEAILAITFTNKAAEEMAERLTGLLGADIAGHVTVKTFHAFGAALLREWADRLGLSPDFAICSDEDRQALLKAACPELRQGEVDAYLARISEAKYRLLAPNLPDLGISSVDGLRPDEPGVEPFGEIYRRYEAALRVSHTLDYDDLIFQTVRLLELRPEVLPAVQDRYRWISVDEYQDVNLAQYRLLRLLTGGGANLCVIGDPDQAIYGFRGADRRYFLSFEQDYPGAVTLHLAQNYRSTQTILDAAMQVIAKSRGDALRSPHDALCSPHDALCSPRDALCSPHDGEAHFAARIFSEFVDQVKLDVYCAPTDKAEAEYIVHQIEQMVGGTSYFSLDSGRVAGENPSAACSFADFAVLYRLTAQNRPLVEAFDRSGIPYQTVGHAPLCAYPAVREVLACLWLLHNPRSRLHLETVLAAGKPTFSAQALAQLWVLWRTQENPVSGALQRAALAAAFTEAQRRRLADLGAFLRQLEQDQVGRSVARLVEQVSKFVAEQRSEPRSALRHPNADAERLAQLARRAAPYDDRLADFLESTALQGETDAYDPRADRVALMTLHAAKGLEFPVVFIVGCEEGLLPYTRQGETPDIEEERRLFYVGMTRAKQKLVLTRARKRFLFGQQMENPPSHFMDDIESALKEIQEMRARRTDKKPESKQLSLF